MTDITPDARDAEITRATLAVTGWNLVSRITGFARVIAMGAALGATALGDTYQSANLVSNILFELLAGGMLSSVLVPTFVHLLDRDERRAASRLAGALLGRTLVILSVIVALAMVAAPWIMRVLTVGVDNDAQRDLQVQLGTFLLFFFLPQVLLYATGAVASALLQADRRFVAAAVAPVFNNVVVIVTMVVFWAMQDGSTSLELDMGSKLVLALGTTAGVLAMTLVPLLAVARRSLPAWPHWQTAGHPLRDLATKGLWAAGHLGLNQLLVAVTIIIAGSVDGGVVAYQMAFTFFLLPHAVLSNPIFTTLFPRLASDAHAGRFEDFARDLGTGVRFTAFVLLPAAGLLAALAVPLLGVVRLGALDEAGAGFVASVLAAYALGLVGYSAFFLLTRASYALGDARGPTIVNGAITLAASAGMLLGARLVDGQARVAMLGIVFSVAVTVGAVGLFRRVHERLDSPIPLVQPLARDLAFAALAALVAWAVASLFDASSRAGAAAAVAIGGTIGVAVYAIGQALARAPELKPAAELAR